MRTPLIAVAALLLIVSPVSAHTITLDSRFGFQYLIFSASAAHVVMMGQTVSLDIIFSGGPLAAPLSSQSAITADLLVSTGDSITPPLYPEAAVFGPGTVAFALDAAGQLLQVPMTDFTTPDGVTAAPAATAGTITTAHGEAGAFMRALLPPGSVVRGVHFDLVLPNTGQIVVGGRIAVEIN